MYAPLRCSKIKAFRLKRAKCQQTLSLELNFVIVLMRGRILLFDFIVSYVEDIVSVGIAKKFL